MRNGEGDYYFILFAYGGCVYTSFEHELMPWDEISTHDFVRQVASLAPHGYADFFSQLAFDLDATSAIGWYDLTDGHWVEAVHPTLHGRQNTHGLLSMVMLGDP